MMFGSGDTTSFTDNGEVKIDNTFMIPKALSTPEEHWSTFSTKTILRSVMYGNGKTTYLADKGKARLEDSWRIPEVSFTPE